MKFPVRREEHPRDLRSNFPHLRTQLSHHNHSTIKKHFTVCMKSKYFHKRRSGIAKAMKHCAAKEKVRQVLASKAKHVKVAEKKKKNIPAAKTNE